MPGQSVKPPAPYPGWIRIGWRNAVSLPGHWFYQFHIDTTTPDEPFCFEEWVGGGHAPGGGVKRLALRDLDGWIGNWREHAAKAGCGWVVDIIDSRSSDDTQAVIEQILSRYVNEQLKEHGVPETSYALGVVKDEALCLCRQGAVWVIFYSERGLQTEMECYESYSAACVAFIARVKKIANGS
ncbi:MULTISPECIES: hypothetical protein [unclassified Pseudomonas]|uniref:hypothetical protein n=1 Tax=unclassified Pseudomonas TaxID=196821 RepID=UPI0025FD50E3|nr:MULTISPECIES: hypothetical protein [unclassified Pseudomonas]